METLSTLRFGLRAKKIENKAKINQELSAAELKRRLEKAIRLVVLLRQMVLNMKAELQTWRSGGSVPQDVWAVIDESLLTEGIAEAGDAVQEILARAQEAIAATASAAAAVVELSPESIVQNGSTSPVSEDLDVIPVASSDISFGSLEGSRYVLYLKKKNHVGLLKLFFKKIGQRQSRLPTSRSTQRTCSSVRTSSLINSSRKRLNLPRSKS